MVDEAKLELLRQRKAEGARVRAFRASKGWKLRELADKLGLHWNTVARMEYGRSRITGRTWAQLAALNGGTAV